MIDLSNYTINQLTKLQSKVNKLISDYSDGHIYICKVRSYGRNWNENWIKNTKTLQDLCSYPDCENCEKNSRNLFLMNMLWE